MHFFINSDQDPHRPNQINAILQQQTRMLEAKAAKFCSKFPQHLFSLTFQLSQPCYVSPFINVYEVVAITAVIKQTKIANECLSFSICLYYPAPPHPAPPYSLPTPTVSQVVTTPREHCSATTLLLHPMAPPPSLVSLSEQTASFQTLAPLFCLSLCPLLVSLMPHFLAFWLFWPQYLGPISLFRVPRPSLTQCHCASQQQLPCCLMSSQDLDLFHGSPCDYGFYRICLQIQGLAASTISTKLSSTMLLCPLAVKGSLFLKSGPCFWALPKQSHPYVKQTLCYTFTDPIFPSDGRYDNRNKNTKSAFFQH